ncbi:extended synaptotagmin-1 isoform X1 [Oryzias latipes]|uniref:Extended synaptotagmin-like protein 1b n=1 Tax=Oryzias latipes TaxID=8090 RepID=H2MI44_ORYLA|nr:extended synaptotagmin-1 isoform X1 [Oryzias latipes]XP_023810939.1 extended synaptotagmin-1 isoform X1 [Oryzias latipes]
MQNDKSEPTEPKGAEGSNPPSDGAEDPVKVKGISAVAVLWTFGKCLSALLPVYLAGYYRVSTSLLVFGMMVYTGWKHVREAKEERLRSAMQLLSDGDDYASSRLSKIKRDLPAWVNFPDVEKVEWLNKVLQQVWPFVGQYLEKLLVETIAPSIRASTTHLQTFNFTKVDMGDKAMKVVGIKAHTENDKGQVLLDLYISYVGNVEINVEVKRYFCKAGVKGIQLHGMMRVILEPLIGDVPIVGAVTMFFIRRPKLDINWTGLTNLFDIPGVNAKSDSMIMDAIASFLVLPNRLVVPLVPDLHLAQLRCPLPRGVVRIHLLEAQNLPAKDHNVKGVMAGLSDPYAVLRVGPQTFTSKHIDNTDCPKWGEMYEVIVHEVPGQELEVEVYDKDRDQDDFLGRTKLDLGVVKNSIVVDDWFTLKESSSGRIHFRLEWLSLLPNTDKLEQVLKKSKAVTGKNLEPLSSAVLVVYLDKAKALPMTKGNKEPNPTVHISVQDTKRESKTCYTTIDPEWEQAFTFFIQDPHKQDIDFQVKDVDSKQLLGSLRIPLPRILEESSLSLDQWFQLENSGPASRIYVNAVLRVLWLDEENIKSDVSSGVAAAMQKPLPQKSSPHPSFATEGLLRIHLLAGQNLVPKDNWIGSMLKGKSDPYVKISIGGETFTSQTIKENLNPTWNEMYEVILTQLPGQELHLEVFDKDMDMKDDFMGRLRIDLKDIIDAQYADQWYALSDVKSGRVHLVLEWVPTSSEADRLDQALQFYSRQSFQNKAVASAGLLFVFVEQAYGLPVKKSGKDPKAGAELILGKVSHKTTVCDRTTSPHWNEAFCFLVRDPREEVLILKLSHSWTLPIGSLVVPMRELLSETDLVLDRWFHLDGASPESQIQLRIELKVLISTKCPGAAEKPKVNAAADHPPAKHKSEADTALKSSSVDTPMETITSSVISDEVIQGKETENDVNKDETEESQSPATMQPLHTSPHLSFATEGLLRIILLEAQDLIAKDNRFGHMVKGKSDPYAVISVGEFLFKSNVVEENLSPVWNEMYEVVLRPQSGQEVQVELFDKDLNKDDFLGRFKICVSDIIQSQFKDQWYTLNDVNSGRVRLITEWVPTVSRNDALAQVMQLQSLQSYRNKAVPSAALLFVFMDRARMLPFKKSGKEPKAGAELLLGNTTYKTKVCERSTSPQWSEAFHFLVHKPKEEMLIVKLSSAWDQPMGSLVVPVKELLSEPQLVLDKWLHLDGASPESEILLRAELKILDTRMTDVPKPSAAASKKEVDAEKIPKAAHVEEKSSELPATQSPKVSEPQKEPEAAHPDLSTEKPDPRKPADVQTTLDVCPSSATIKEQSQDLKTHHEPSAQTDCTTMEDLAQSTFSGLPTDKKPSAKVSEIPKAETALQSRTTPPRDFGKEGVLRIHLLEAKNLVAKDIVLGKGKSDPYVKINIGGFMFKSHVIKENLNPTWNEMYEVVLSGNHDQDIKFEAFDKDLNSDDFLGRFSVRLNEVMSAQYTDQWFTLKDVKSGQVHVILEWVPTVSSSIRLDQVMQLESLQSYQNKAVPSAALLFVYIQAAQSLPLKKSGKEPRAGAELVLGEASSKTKLCDRSANPQWNESFHFVVRDPKRQTLIVKLSSGWDEPMGSLVVPVRELLSEPELVLDRWFHLDGASAYSQILLRAELKILNTKMLHLIGTEALPCAAASAGQLKMSLTYAPQQKKLVVLVHACRGLLAQSKDGVDSYVSLMLLPDKTKATKRKTAVKKKDLNPEYNERFEFDLPEQEVPFKCLSASVKNNSFRGKDVIGQVQVELAQMDLKSGITQWFALSDEAE